MLDPFSVVSQVTLAMPDSYHSNKDGSLDTPYQKSLVSNKNGLGHPSHITLTLKKEPEHTKYLEEALEKAKSAVYLDSLGHTKEAKTLYLDAVTIIEGLLRTAELQDRTQLEDICGSYTERIQYLLTRRSVIANHGKSQVSCLAAHPVYLSNLPQVRARTAIPLILDSFLPQEKT
ncbi:hypothetical protein BDF14DRAFT_1807576 [Spinellus fusiger]|nr:hypothetical protein BDF14DRAFT_1807576 [Spinellus fusiger]